jgi:hypothetical protein
MHAKGRTLASLTEGAACSPKERSSQPTWRVLLLALARLPTGPDRASEDSHQAALSRSHSMRAYRAERAT